MALVQGVGHALDEGEGELAAVDVGVFGHELRERCFEGAFGAGEEGRARRVPATDQGEDAFEAAGHEELGRGRVNLEVAQELVASEGLGDGAGSGVAVGSGGSAWATDGASAALALRVEGDEVAKVRMRTMVKRAASRRFTASLSGIRGGRGRCDD